MNSRERIAADELDALLSRSSTAVDDANLTALNRRDAFVAAQMTAAAGACAPEDQFVDALETRLRAVAAARARGETDDSRGGLLAGARWLRAGLRNGLGLRMRSIAAAAALLCLVFGLTLWASPAARAALEQIIHRIGGMTFEEVAALPTPAAQATPAYDPGKWWTLSEAQANLPFTLHTPAWVPDGFQLRDEVQVWPPRTLTGTSETNTWQVILTWESKERGWQRKITLWEAYSSEGMRGAGGVVGPDGVKEASVNGTPVAVVNGSWTQYSPASMPVRATPQWTNSALSLSWLGEGNTVMYRLEAGAGDASQEDLMRIVSTMR